MSGVCFRQHKLSLDLQTLSNTLINTNFNCRKSCRTYAHRFDLYCSHVASQTWTAFHRSSLCTCSSTQFISGQTAAQDKALVRSIIVWAQSHATVRSCKSWNTSGGKSRRLPPQNAMLSVGQKKVVFSKIFIHCGVFNGEYTHEARGSSRLPLTGTVLLKNCGDCILKKRSFILHSGRNFARTLHALHLPFAIRGILQHSVQCRAARPLEAIYEENRIVEAACRMGTVQTRWTYKPDPGELQVDKYSTRTEKL